MFKKTENGLVLVDSYKVKERVYVLIFFYRSMADKYPDFEKEIMFIVQQYEGFIDKMDLLVQSPQGYFRNKDGVICLQALKIVELEAKIELLYLSPQIAEKTPTIFDKDHFEDF